MTTLLVIIGIGTLTGWMGLLSYHLRQHDAHLKAHDQHLVALGQHVNTLENLWRGP